MKTATIATLILLFAFSAFSQKMTDLDKLVATERAFARAAAEKSTKEAFLEYLADDSIVFEPGPVNGKDVWSKRPPSVGLLSWEPVWADISADGSIGYTTGPWDFRPKGKDGEPVAFGEYVTIWKKQKDGNFKAILDIGISHGKPAGSAPELRFPEDAVSSPEGPQSELAPESVAARRLAPGFRLYRDGEFVFTGKEAKERLKAEKSEFGRFSCIGRGGLHWCFGSVKLSFGSYAAKQGNFLKVFRYRARKWEMALDLFAETPEQ